MDKYGIEYSENNAFGFQVIRRFLITNVCFVMDEAEGSTSQKGDGHIGGMKLVCIKI